MSGSLTNIFLGRYEQHENQLTYCFLSLLEHLRPARAAALLSCSGRFPESPGSIVIDTIYGGFGGNPDGSVSLNYGSRTSITFLEVKSTVRPPEAEQIIRHLRDRVGSSTDKTLLVIAARPQEGEFLSLQQEYEPHLQFVTWREIADRCGEMAKEDPGSKDCFLLQQFAEYPEKEPYAGVAGMIRRDEVEAIAQLNEFMLREMESKFERKAWALMTKLKDDVLGGLSAKIAKSEVKQEGHSWILVNCDLGCKNCSVQFGIRYQDDPSDFLLNKHQPEFGVWIAIGTAAHVVLDSDSKLQKPAMALTASRYGVNIPARSKGSAWLLCYWFAPVSDFVETELDFARVMAVFNERLQILFDSEFLRRTVELTR
jgi:hypothetical protein